MFIENARERQLVTDQPGMWRVLILAGPILALPCRRAALRDENNGFPFTAAMQWRKAAEMSSWIAPLAIRYWREWERIMQVPRGLAEPIGVAAVGAIALLQQRLPFERCRRAYSGVKADIEAASRLKAKHRISDPGLTDRIRIGKSSIIGPANEGMSQHIMSLSQRITAVFVVLFFLNFQAGAAAPSKSHFKAVAFDYFVIFDPNSLVPEVEKEFPGKGLEFTKAWRSKQFEYGFLRTITNDYEDFFKVTGDALDYTAEQMHLEFTSATRERLLNAYLNLKPWPDAVAALKRLKAAGVRIITIANFRTTMLRANADHAGITNLFDELLSTEVNGTFKPDPHAYELGMKRLHLRKDEMVFAAFGGWDAYGARRLGYATYWVNRFNLPAEKLGTTPDGTSTNMDGLLEFVLAGSAG
jgi:2-haloacid dehalogenase